MDPTACRQLANDGEIVGSLVGVNETIVPEFFRVKPTEDRIKITKAVRSTSGCRSHMKSPTATPQFADPLVWFVPLCVSSTLHRQTLPSLLSSGISIGMGH